VLAARLSADFSTSAGSFTNSYTGADKIDNSRSYDVASRFIYTPDADTEVDVKFRAGSLDGAAIRNRWLAAWQQREARLEWLSERLRIELTRLDTALPVEESLQPALRDAPAAA